MIVTDTYGLQHVLTTGPGGNYSVTVPAGPATVDVNGAQLPAGATLATGSSDPTAVVVPAGGVATDNTGYTLQFVQGMVYNDLNYDGQYQPGIDAPLVNMRVVVSDSQGMTHVVTTNAGGYFSQPVPAGWVVVDVDQTNVPAGFGLTIDTQGEGNDPTTIMVPAGGSAADNTGYTGFTQLEFKKTGSEGPVRAGQLITYQLVVRNTGTAIANNVVVTDNAPLNTTFVSASGLAAGQIDSNGSRTVFSIGTLAVGQSSTVTFTVRVVAESHGTEDSEPGTAVEPQPATNHSRVERGQEPACADGGDSGCV